jgi:hypothetical protein
VRTASNMDSPVTEPVSLSLTDNFEKS